MNARPTRPTGIFTARAALCLTLGAVLLASSVPAFAGDDDVPIDTKILRGVMESLGLRRDGEAINYEERAPLVIPPSHDLPPPERSDAAIANNPAWPIDPDVKRRKEEAAQERRKSALNADQTLLRDQSVLRPDELTPGPKPRKAARQGDGGSYESSPYGYGNPISPSKLGSKGNIFSKMFEKDDAGKQQLHRRAAARVSDRAAARLPDAVTAAALWRWPDEGGCSHVGRLPEGPSGGRSVSRYVLHRVLLLVAGLSRAVEGRQRRISKLMSSQQSWHIRPLMGAAAIIAAALVASPACG